MFLKVLKDKLFRDAALHGEVRCGGPCC